MTKRIEVNEVEYEEALLDDQDIGEDDYGFVFDSEGNVKFVFVPKENEDDFNKIIKRNTTLIDEEFKVKIVSHISEILEYVLLDDKIVNKLREKNKSRDITFEKTFDIKTYFK